MLFNDKLRENLFNKKGKKKQFSVCCIDHDFSHFLSTLTTLKKLFQRVKDRNEMKTTHL